MKSVKAIRKEMRDLRKMIDAEDITQLAFQMRYRELSKQLEEAENLPPLARQMFTADLVFCLIHAFAVLTTLVNYETITSRVENTGLFNLSIGVSVAIAIFGISANILLLTRKREGVLLAYINVTVTFCAIIMAIFQSGLVYQQISYQFIASLFAFIRGLHVLIRLVLVIVYIYSLSKFSQWAKLNLPAPKSGSSIIPFME